MGAKKATTKRATPAKYFRRARADRATEVAEDYVETVADLIDEMGCARVVDIARALGVSHVTVIRTVARLQRDGLVDSEPYKTITLTAAGRALAVASRKRHETVENFLLALGISEETARADSEGIEHHVSEETLAAFARFKKLSARKK